MADLEVHLLDPGAIEYGDCALCLIGNYSILIDGGKKASAGETRDTVLGRDIVHDSIQAQVESILGGTVVDLLIITHCHSDHVGALPRLIKSQEITCVWALVADPQYGFGIGGDSGPIPPPAKMTPAEKLWLALREEPVHSKNDAVVREFIEDAAAEYQEYVSLVEFLQEEMGGRLVRYRGPTEVDSDGLDLLLESLEETGLHIFGPSLKQLANCSTFLVGRSEDVAAIEHDLTKEGTVDLVAAYRREIARAAQATAAAGDGTPEETAEAAEDTAENGNAVNNQSIVLSIGHGASRALLTGDMQFVRPQVSSDIVKEEMKKLREAISADVAQNGKFGFVKLSHHGAINGQNLALLQEWGSGLFGISTGSASTKHPTAPVLAALKELGKPVKWGRTDLNGAVTYKATGDQLRLLKERGKWNDTTPPAERAGDAGPAEAPPPPAPAPAPPVPAPAIPMLPQSVSTVSLSQGDVEVTVKFPYRKGKVRVTIESDPEASSVPLS